MEEGHPNEPEVGDRRIGRSSKAIRGRDTLSQGTSDRMIATARRILARDGMAGLTLEVLSDEASVNKSATRYHFGDKQGLLTAVVRSIMVDESAASQVPAPVAATWQERVDAFLEYTNTINSTRDSFRTFLAILPYSSKDAAMKREFTNLYQQWFQRNAQWLGIEEGDINDESLLGVGMLMAAVVDGLAVQQAIFEDDYDPTPMLAVFRRVLLQLKDELAGEEGPNQSQEAPEAD